MDEVNVFKNGPDQIVPSKCLKTWEADGTVQLNISQYGPASEQTLSVYSFLKKRNNEYPDVSALAVKRGGVWRFWSYRDYFNECCIVAKAFIKLGLENFRGVCIMGFNSPEWVIANYGCIFAGGLSAGIYTTSSPDACRYVADNCEAQIILVENAFCLNKILAVKRYLPKLKAIIQWDGVPGAPGVISWDELLAIGSAESEAPLNYRLSMAAVNQCCTLIYTSGTTGPPKGVMCSQDHLTWTAAQYENNNKMTNGCQTILSYLPLSHLAAQMVDIYLATQVAATVYFALPDALQGSLGQTLVEVQPTLWLAVPRVWEKMYEKMQEVSNKSGFLKKKVGTWAKSHGLNYHQAILEGRQLSTYEMANYYLAKKLIFNKIKMAIGLSRILFCASGSAPIDKNILDYFMSIDIPILEGYGLSESLSVCSFNYFKTGEMKIGSVGKVQSLTNVKLIDVDNKRPGEGEICMSGRNICMGYLNMPDKTNETIDDDGWLHSGDIGKFDSDGFLFITGRLKELIITAGGENIPPVIIEDAIKKRLPVSSNVMLIGDKRKFLSILLTLKSEIDDETGTPLDTLTAECIDFLKGIESNSSTVTQAREEVSKLPHGPLSVIIQNAITEYNECDAVSKAQKVQKWVILPHDFSASTGELNNTLKLKRNFVLQKYAGVIDTMYDSVQTTRSKL